jgi:bacterioferritin-associated ferredoxin
MRYISSTLSGLAALVGIALACGSCDNPLEAVVHERNVRRMQPEASDAVSGPKAQLEWGQLNFMHTVRMNTSIQKAKC